MNKFSEPAPVHKTDDAADLGKQRVVPAAAHVLARLDGRPALPHQDGTARDQLASEPFYAQPLRVGIPAVARTP